MKRTHKRTATVRVEQPGKFRVRTEITLNGGKPNELRIEAWGNGSYRIIGLGHAFHVGNFSIHPEIGNVIVIRATNE